MDKLPPATHIKDGKGHLKLFLYRPPIYTTSWQTQESEIQKKIVPHS